MVTRRHLWGNVNISFLESALSSRVKLLHWETGRKERINKIYRDPLQSRLLGKPDAEADRMQLLAQDELLPKLCVCIFPELNSKQGCQFTRKFH